MAVAGDYLRRWHDPSTGRAGYLFYCPGCEIGHSVGTEGGPPSWNFDGNLEKPTFLPSVRCFTEYSDEDNPDGSPKKLPAGKQRTLCHLFVKEGMIQFLSDCEHTLAGKTVPLPKWPANYGGGE